MTFFNGSCHNFSLVRFVSFRLQTSLGATNFVWMHSSWLVSDVMTLRRPECSASGRYSAQMFESAFESCDFQGVRMETWNWTGVEFRHAGFKICNTFQCWTNCLHRLMDSLYWLPGWLAGTAREHQFSFVQICLRTNIETHVHSSQHQDLLLTFYFGHILKSQTLISILANREENGE